MMKFDALMYLWLVLLVGRFPVAIVSDCVHCYV